MQIATVNGTAVPWKCICTHWTGWNKPADNVLPIRLTLPIGYAVERFAAYWTEFIERESEQDGEEPEGIYQALRLLGYPDLDTMMRAHAETFEQLVMQGLQTEFLGFIVEPPSAVLQHDGVFFMRSLNLVKVEGEQLVLEGNGFALSARPLNPD